MTIPAPPVTSPPPNAPQSAHKAWLGGALGAASMLAGILLGALQVIAPEDIVNATGAPAERVAGWFRIGMALLAALAAAGAATGFGVYQIRNKPAP